MFSTPENPITLQEGSTGVALDVWVDNDLTEAITGLGLDILSSDPAVLGEAVWTPDTPAGRWLSAGVGVAGDLIIDANAVAVPQFGSDGIVGGTFVRHGTVTFDVTGVAGDTTELSLAESNSLIVTQSGRVTGINFGTASIQITAIPEPGTAACLAVLGCTVFVLPRRRRKS